MAQHLPHSLLCLLPKTVSRQEIVPLLCTLTNTHLSLLKCFPAILTIPTLFWGDIPSSIESTSGSALRWLFYVMLRGLCVARDQTQASFIQNMNSIFELTIWLHFLLYLKREYIFYSFSSISPSNTLCIVDT